MALTLKTSPGLRVVLLGALALLLLIPLLQVRGLIDERQQRAYEVEQSIAAQWGAAQTLAGAYLTVTVPARAATSNFDLGAPARTHVLLADTLDVEVQLKPELRYRGMFEVPVYLADIHVSARFARADVRALLAQVPADQPLYVRLALSDTRGLRELGALRVNEQDLRAQIAPSLTSSLHGLGVALPDSLRDEAGDIALSYRLNLAGVRSLNFLPYARTTDVRLRGNWPAPDFQGDYLPRTRHVGVDGFDAQWQILELNRALTQWWIAQDTAESTIGGNAFGVNLFQPANVYQQNERSGKYGILVIALLFVAMFLFETLGGVVLHPIQYLLIGLALTVFYLLLLALSEHLGFAWAYLVAAAAAVLVVAGYLRAVLRSTARAGLVAALHAGAYAVFFLLVRSEDYALLLGATVLFAAVALLMFLTRHVSWQNLARPSQG